MILKLVSFTIYYFTRRASSAFVLNKDLILYKFDMTQFDLIRFHSALFYLFDSIDFSFV